MVLLSRIYTKTGDDGTTSLGDGRRARKDAPRIEAYGTVDELNALLGLALVAVIDQEGADLLRSVQNDLFDLGADLCLPETKARAGRRRAGRAPLRITAGQVKRLEEAIDRFNAPLGILHSFVLPGGTPASAWLHLARTVCRRAERAVVTLTRREKVNPQVIVYLNRLSDLLFVMARRANDGGRADVLWIPGRGGTPT
ncbi:MAG TPA: cob(I)yrinic acid a,c-diamide adenosyltransferase [Candidatus Polarisedimenticolia bacterium]|nr:cob(I)yrinic acid a,c-diamide adenosyltransferase [Candidatus Polarisedimenticolia bacterium]